MVRYFLLILFWVFFIMCSGQDTLPRFAIVILPAISAGTKDDCWLYYSNGSKEDLTIILNLESEKMEINVEANTFIVINNEFKLLEYMRSKGFGLLNVNYAKMLGRNQFYFERK